MTSSQFRKRKHDRRDLRLYREKGKHKHFVSHSHEMRLKTRLRFTLRILFANTKISMALVIADKIPVEATSGQNAPTTKKCVTMHDCGGFAETHVLLYPIWRIGLSASMSEWGM